MWYNLGKWVLRNRLPLIIAVLLSTAVMTYFASKVERSYDFAKAIPVDHPKFLEYEAFKQKFGEDGSLLVIGFEKKDLFQLPFFQTFVELQQQIKQVTGVEDVLSVSAAVNLVKDSASEKLRTTTVFPENIQTQAVLDSCKTVLLNLPFYKGLFYNPDSNVYMIAVRLNKEVLNSKKRNASVDGIVNLATAFEQKEKLKMLKRYLRSTYNMSPDDYRKRWGLPPDYPMVAPNYAKARSELAKQMGLGQGGRKPARATRAKK